MRGVRDRKSYQAEDAVLPLQELEGDFFLSIPSERSFSEERPLELRRGRYGGNASI